MSIQFSGIGSGMDYAAWVEKLVSARKTVTITPLENKKLNLQNESSALSTIKTSFSELRSVLQKFTKTISGTSNDFWSKVGVTSSNEKYVTATGSNGLTPGEIKVSVEQLATKTVAQSTKVPTSTTTVTNKITADTKFSDINPDAKDGYITITADTGSTTYERQIYISPDEKIDDIIKKINMLGTNISGATFWQAELTSNGQIRIVGGNSSRLIRNIGKDGDTSNFVEIMGLKGQIGYEITGTTSTYEQTVPGGTIKLDDPLTKAVTEGTIKINDASFTIDDKTTLQSLINQINLSSKANVNVRFNTVSNKLTFTSKETGATNIEFKANGTDFFEVFGLTTGGTITPGSQVLGQNAILTVDGNRIESTSNVVTGDVSGIRGLTITAKRVTDGANPDNVSEVTLTIGNDTTDLKAALKDFVNAYNKVSEQISEATAKGGYLATDISLKSIQRDFRNMLNYTANDFDLILTNIPNIWEGEDFAGGSDYMSVRGALMPLLGISTGDAGLSVDDRATTLKFNEEIFDKMWEAAPFFAKLTLVGGEEYEDYSFDGIPEGIFAKMEKKLNNILDPVSGMFATRANSLSRMISYQDERITRAYNSLSSYESQLTSRFQYMDEMIAKLQQQYASFSKQ